MNLYNAVVLEAVRAEGLTGDLRRHRGFFHRAGTDVGGLRFPLHVIEHGLLRRARPAPWTFWPSLSPGDPRRVWMLDAVDARVHFALNCGARSCPPIRAYTPEAWHTQLDLATRAYLGDVRVEGGALVLPYLLKLYRRDIPDPLRRFAGHLPEPVRDWLTRHPDPPIRWAPYDWQLIEV